VDQTEADSLWSVWWDALGEIAALQATYQAAVEPTGRFLQMLSSAIAAGRAHLAGPDGGEPECAVAWGWQETRSEWGVERRPRGERVGWVDGEHLYLEPDAAYAAVQRLARDGGDSLPVTAPTLWRRLHERGLLASVDGPRQTLKIRRRLEGRQHGVLHLQAASLSDHTVPDKPDIRPSGNGAARTFRPEMSGAVSGHVDDQTPVRSRNGETAFEEGVRDVGFVGSGDEGEMELPTNVAARPELSGAAADDNEWERGRV
jgi:hypothetical protein